MEKNRKIIKIGVTSIFLAVILCLITAEYLKLEKPVFFKNYCELSSPFYRNAEGAIEQQEIAIAMQYVTNISDQRTIVDVRFPEAPQLNVSVAQSNFNTAAFVFGPDAEQTQGTTYGRYSLRMVTAAVSLPNPEEELRDQENIVLTQAVVVYQNGESQEIPLGKIILSYRFLEEDPLEPRTSTSSSDGTSSAFLFAKDDICILDVSSPLQEEFRDMIEITINKKDYESIDRMPIKKGNSVEIFTKMKITSDSLNRYDTYKIVPEMIYEDSNGKQFREKIYNMDYIPYHLNQYSFFGLVKYLHGRGML